MKSKKKEFITPWFEVESERYDSLPRFGKKPVYRINAPDGVLIIPYTKEGKFVLVKQFRPAINEVTLEFPAGEVDAKETGEKTAARELYEETGYICEKIYKLGEGAPMTNRMNTRAFIFFGEEAVCDTTFQPKEHIEVVTVSPGDCKKLALEGKIAQLPTMSALLLLHWKLAHKLPKEVKDIFR